ncbi:hypothetical protein [Niabella drilacis]|uniref:hypothetical protein n=1 Tax=Niabella drilacis (strain DSM 25811 / CCM 8410 / CCUG 62505 / LMG 26954 / E90) TaxID=1285928 RepID=UPI00115FA5F6|nr:hypothetical protein [Niabella drilacis]
MPENAPGVLFSHNLDALALSCFGRMLYSYAYSWWLLRQSIGKRFIGFCQAERFGNHFIKTVTIPAGEQTGSIKADPVFFRKWSPGLRKYQFLRIPERGAAWFCMKKTGKAVPGPLTIFPLYLYSDGSGAGL